MSFRTVWFAMTLCLLFACSAHSHPNGVLASDADAKSTQNVEVVTTCSTDADCAVKNVGNCCGFYPACVNKDSPTDPEGVAARCREMGTMSVCGFQNIAGCQCVSGQCQPVHQRLLPPEPVEPST